MHVRPFAMLAVTGMAVAGVVAIAPPSQAADCLARPGFYANGDRYPDLAVGVPNQGFGAAKRAGAVTIVYGGADGLFGRHGSKLFRQENLGGRSEKGDHFGAALAVGDLNRDGCYDLVIGVPGEDASRGRVQIVYGTPHGMTGAPRQTITQKSPGVPGGRKAHDEFGAAVAVQHFSSTAALWVGVPGKDIGAAGGAGAVIRIPGGKKGGKLATKGIKFFSQRAAAVPGKAQNGARFGSVLSATRRSLLVGVPHEDVAGLSDAGAVFVYRAGKWTWFGQGSAADGRERGDRFGASVGQISSCTGRTADEAYVVGAPGEDIAGVADAGRVTVVDQPAGKTLSIEQDAAGLTNEQGDNFGLRLAAKGHLLVSSIPNKDLTGARNAGAAIQASMSCDTSGTPTVAAVSTLSLEGPVRGDPRNGDRFGMSLALVAGPAAHPLELAVGVPLEADGSVNDAGRVTVFSQRSTDGLFATAGTWNFGQSSAGIVGGAQTSDQFGAAVAGG